MMRMKNLGALLVGGMLALAGCAGSDGSQGPQGPKGDKGDTGSIGPTAMNGATGQKLKLVLEGVVTAPVNGTNTATLTFVVYPAANVCPGGTCSTNLSILGQKTLYAAEYNANTKSFSQFKDYSFGSIAFKEITADGKGARYTAIKANPPFTVETSTSAFLYGYIATTGVVPAPTTGHYSLPSSVSSAAKLYGSVTYTSNAVVSGCEKCHGAPYSKHGYRQATVAGLPDFVACKVCHLDDKSGNDWSWYAIADDPAQLAADPTGLASVTLNGALAPYKNRYAYTLNIMNDVHNSHAFEFNYPQSMANCVVCHQGKLANILTDANFKPSVCKSCHPARAVAGVESGRAPAMHDLWAATNLLAHDNPSNRLDPYYTVTADNACNVCHFAGNLDGAKTFAQIHKGYNEQIYSDGNGTKYSASRTATIASASYDAASYVATVSFSVSGVSTTAAVVVPTVVGSLYGYDTKDMLVTGHSSSPKIECTSGVGVCTAAMTLAQGADAASFVATINLSTWANLINAGQVKRMEVGILPVIAIDPTAAVSTTTGNLAAVVTGVTKTIDLTSTKANAIIADASVYGKKIVDPAKCNACHDALGTTFHSPSYGSAGVVACRLCHTPQSAASHLEVQSRSIDSYVHAIHAMQYLDTKNVNFTDVVAKSRYNDHVEGNYPNFAGPLNCESCHYAGTYDPPNQAKSLPGFISVIAAPTARTGMPAPGALPQEITGPGARACGACHRAFALNEGDGEGLAKFVAHTNKFSTYATSAMDPAYSATNTAAYIQYLVGGTTSSVPATIGAQVEQCGDCHATGGADHQTLFNTWRTGTVQ